MTFITPLQDIDQIKIVREAIVAEAKSWLRTPYHHAAFIKGAGVDCAFLLIKVYNACGLLPDIDPRPYPPDWMLHRDEERYLGWVKEYADQVDKPLPGDVVLYKFGRCISHGGIVVQWPMIIHAYRTEGVVLSNGMQEPIGVDRLAGFYSLRSLSYGR